MVKPHPRRILLPLAKVVGDKTGRLHFIAELARSFHAQVTLFHLTGDREPQGTPEDINQFRAQLEMQNIEVSLRCSKGFPGKAINVEAISHHNDLILLGVSGRGLFRRLFFGNIIGDLLNQPPCNTILFRAAP